MGKKRIDEQLLIDAALDEFSANSFDESSINRIIAKSGITKGSFYYRFSTKYDLYLHLLKLGNQKKWEFINSDPEVSFDASDDIFDLFEKQAKSGMKFASIHPRYHLLGKMLSREKGNPVYKRALSDLNSSDEPGLGFLIRKAYDKGNFGEEYTFEFIEKVITSLFLSFDEILFRDEEIQFDKAMSYLKEFITFLQFGLKGR